MAVTFTFRKKIKSMNENAVHGKARNTEKEQIAKKCLMGINRSVVQ